MSCKPHVWEIDGKMSLWDGRHVYQVSCVGCGSKMVSSSFQTIDFSQDMKYHNISSDCNEEMIRNIQEE